MKWKNGFYCDSEAPEGAVELTEEEYSALVCGQAEGLTIEEENGFPVLKDKRPSAEENEKKRKVPCSQASSGKPFGRHCAVCGGGRRAFFCGT